MATIHRTAIIAALLLLTGLLMPPAAQQDPGGYRQDYDFPGQGDAWYGGMQLPQEERDFDPTFLDQILSGDDFCRGYEPWFDPLGLGPPLFRTDERNSAYAFRFGSAIEEWPCIGFLAVGQAPPNCNDGNRCTTDSWSSTLGRCVHSAVPNGTSCSDGVSCNGAETCQSGTCTSGTPPSCDDGDACTTDYCDTATDACRHDAPPVPAEVQQLRMALEAPGFTVAIVSWLEQPEAEYYDLYRSTVQDLEDLVCFIPEIVGTTIADDGFAPAPWDALFYLSTAVNCAGESPLGTGTPSERQPLEVCR